MPASSRTVRLCRGLATIAALLAAAPEARAQMDASAPMPSLPPIVREEPAVPRFLAPNEFRTEDFRVEWVGDPVPGVELSLEPDSLQWARVDGVLRLPRARLAVAAESVEGGTVQVAGFVQTLSRIGEEATLMGGESLPGEADGTARMLIPLVSGEGNAIDVSVLRDDRELRGRAVVRFAPRRTSFIAGPRVYVDTTCSSYNVRFETSGGREDQWMYVGCRNVTARSEGDRTNSLEIVVFWDNVGRAIEVDGITTDSGGDSIWNLRASSSPGFVELFAGDQRVALRYAVANRPHRGSLGIGIGPYFDTFEGTGNDRETVEPLVTLYGSYAVTPWSRLVLFNATPIREDGYSDTGFYLQKRTSEALDRRVSANVFLGGHYLVFQAEDPFDGEKKLFRRWGAPQGVEFLFRDVPRPGFNVIAGGLTNPGFGGTSYYNLWLRWGNPYMFVELNYIAWQEAITNPDDEDDHHEVELRSIGLSVGFPLIKFL